MNTFEVPGKVECDGLPYCIKQVTWFQQLNGSRESDSPKTLKLGLCVKEWHTQKMLYPSVSMPEEKYLKDEDYFWRKLLCYARSTSFLWKMMQFSFSICLYPYSFSAMLSTWSLAIALPFRDSAGLMESQSIFLWSPAE